ncbi:unnamed protein product, partial [Brenthis ino]
MSSFLCFICHSTVNKETNEETRDKYREVVGINLCPDSQLCYICCHVLNKLSLFRSICLKRSLEYPVLFREKGTLNLQKSDLEIHVLCPEDCNQYQRSKFYQFSYNNDFNDTNYNNDNEYVKLEHENVFHEYFNQCQYQNVENNEVKEENNYHYNRKIDENNDIYVTENIDVNTDVANDNDTDIESNEEDNKNEITLNENANVNTDLEKIIKNENNESEHNLFNVENGNNDNEAKEDNDKNIVLEDLNGINDKKPKNKKVSKKKKSKKKGFKKTILSIEEQKAELEANRKEKKYIEAEFKCYNCALGFLFKDTYQAHMMRHEESNGEHQCVTCTLRFTSLALLRVHAANHAERHTCSACGAALRPRAARAHRCGGRAGEREGEGGKAACHVCGNLFRDANGLQQHIRRVHTNKASGRLHSCGVCGDSFNTHATLRTHMIKHVKRTFPCSQCGARYRSPYTRAQHERSHARAPPAACACGALYASRKSLLAHLRTHVSHQQTLFECPICNRICPNQRSLTSHVQTVHSPSAEHACPACPARYTSRKSLVRHMAKHNKKAEVTMAVCYLCGNSFKGNNKLNRHLREVCEKAKLEEQISELYE